MNQRENDDLRPEYPAELIRSGIRGKYAKRFKEGSNVVVIDPDLSDAFPNSEAVNEALRDYLASQRADCNMTRRSSRRPTRCAACSRLSLVDIGPLAFD